MSSTDNVNAEDIFKNLTLKQRKKLQKQAEKQAAAEAAAAAAEAAAAADNNAMDTSGNNDGNNNDNNMHERDDEDAEEFTPATKKARTDNQTNNSGNSRNNQSSLQQENRFIDHEFMNSGDERIPGMTELEGFTSTPLRGRTLASQFASASSNQSSKSLPIYTNDIVNDFIKLSDHLSRQHNPLVSSGVLPQEQRLEDYEYQHTVEDTNELLSTLVEKDGSVSILELTGSSFEDTNIGVVTWDSSQAYSWALFRKLYPHPFPRHTLNYCVLPRGIAEDHNTVISREHCWVSSLAELHPARKLLKARLRHLYAKLPAQTTGNLWSMGNSMHGRGLMATNSMASSMAMVPNQIHTEPVITSLITSLTEASILAFKDTLQTFRAAHGQAERKKFFEELTWQRVMNTIEDTHKGASVEWSDEEWLNYILLRIRGEDTAKVLGGQDTVLLISTLIDKECPILFSDLEKWQEDSDAFIAGLQRSVQNTKFNHRGNLSVEDYAKLIKMICPKFEEKGQNSCPLPWVWTQLINRSRKRLLEAGLKKTPDLDILVIVFSEELATWRNYLFSFKHSTHCSLSAMVAYDKPKTGTLATSSRAGSSNQTAANASANKSFKPSTVAGASASATTNNKGKFSGASNTTAVPAPQASDKTASDAACTGCGRSHPPHNKDNCKHKQHANFNKLANVTWKKCNFGKEFRTFGYDYLPEDRNITLAALRDGLAARGAPAQAGTSSSSQNNGKKAAPNK